MTLSEVIFAVNSVIQQHLNAYGLRTATPDEVAPLVYQSVDLPCEGGPPGAPAFQLREFFRMIRRSHGHEALFHLLGVKQKDNREGARYTLLRFDPPALDRIEEILRTALPASEAKEGHEENGQIESLPDYLQDGLDVVFVGTSVGDESSARQHYYAHPTNRFWDLVNESGLVGDWVGSENDHCIIDEKCGLTDIAKKKVSSSDRKLAPEDFDVDGFKEKIVRYRPKVVAFNGKRAYKEVFRKDPTDYGLADDIIADSYVWVLPSSSGSDTSLTFEKKLHWYKKLKATLRTV